MKLLKHMVLAMAITTAFTGSSVQATGIPTVDIASITAQAASWYTQYEYVKDQIVKAQAQVDQLKANYDQAKSTADALKGARGMGALLSDASGQQSVASDFAQLVDKMRQLGAGAASAQAKSIYDAIKSFDCGAQFPKNATARTQCESRTLILPTVIATLNESLSRSQTRAAQLQQLVDSIDTADDMKAAADLQNRISAELARLNNEQIIAGKAHELLRAQSELNLQAAREEGLKRMSVGNTVNPFGK